MNIRGRKISKLSLILLATTLIIGIAFATSLTFIINHTYNFGVGTVSGLATYQVSTTTAFTGYDFGNFSAVGSKTCQFDLVNTGNQPVDVFYLINDTVHWTPYDATRTWNNTQFDVMLSASGTAIWDNAKIHMTTGQRITITVTLYCQSIAIPEVQNLHLDIGY